MTKVMVRFPVKPEFFFRFFFNRLGCLFNCEDHLHFHKTIIVNCFSKSHLSRKEQVLSPQRTSTHLLLFAVHNAFALPGFLF